METGFLLKSFPFHLFIVVFPLPFYTKQNRFFSNFPSITPGDINLYIHMSEELHSEPIQTWSVPSQVFTAIFQFCTFWGSWKCSLCLLGSSFPPQLLLCLFFASRLALVHHACLHPYPSPLPSSSLRCLVADRLCRPDRAPKHPGVKAGWKVKWLHGGFTSIIRM